MPEPFRAIADPTRREIMDMLRISGQLRAGDIANHFPDVTRINISKHLKVLQEAQLVQRITTDDARERMYALNQNGFQQFAAWLKQYDVYWEQKLKDLKHMVEEAESKEDSS